MSTDYGTLVSKVWNYAHVLRDQGIGYGDYVEQITFLLFRKMDQERTESLNGTSLRLSRPNGAGRNSGRWRATSWNSSTATRWRRWPRKRA